MFSTGNLISLKPSAFHSVLQLKGKDGGKPIGRISKQWSGILKEVFTDTDNFGIQFPLDMDVKIKAVLLGACFLIVRYVPLICLLPLSVPVLLCTSVMSQSLLFFAGFHVLWEGGGGQPTQHRVFIEKENMVVWQTSSACTFCLHTLCLSALSLPHLYVLPRFSTDQRFPANDKINVNNIFQTSWFLPPLQHKNHILFFNKNATSIHLHTKCNHMYHFSALKFWFRSTTLFLCVCFFF